MILPFTLSLSLTHMHTHGTKRSVCLFVCTFVSVSFFVNCFMACDVMANNYDGDEGKGQKGWKGKAQVGSQWMWM